ncbi:hypothetical protein DMB92_08860 [Campylobacter sp. MIT 99-7217]|uniref:hypothetical protein n=1 Tax=Campylobacter sp. MIT 99-7217 TaxID=535091 RepID=UPI00115C17E6|nr:hypothetical protein [Campylobacter sp. MIT 99-7217]TQR28936.1 hypothetical protein DMB92_08860 [Campylobacter sp. MIT 99-7217]
MIHYREDGSAVYLSEFAIKAYGADKLVKRENYETQESFELALAKVVDKNDAWHVYVNEGSSFTQPYLARLPKELQEPFLKTIEGEEMDSDRYFLMEEMIMRVVTFGISFKENEIDIASFLQTRNLPDDDRCMKNIRLYSKFVSFIKEYENMSLEVVNGELKLTQPRYKLFDTPEDLKNKMLELQVKAKLKEAEQTMSINLLSIFDERKEQTSLKDEQDKKSLGEQNLESKENLQAKA